MRVLVFPKILHGGEVYSVVINHTGKQLLTIGKDGILNLWQVDDLIALNQHDKSRLKSTIDTTEPIKTFTYHDAMVTAVKWSPIHANKFVSGDVDGKLYLNDVEADDKLLYPRHGSSSGVVDITWSVDGRLISWSTRDGKVHIYDVHHDTYQQLTSLLHQEKLVIQRSIAFDPKNKYLVTLGDDTIISVYQFRYEKDHYQFKILHKITRFIDQNNANINYNRISWSSNGEYLLIPSAKKNQTTLVTLISRSKNWETALNLLGHGSNCEVVKFNPCFFKCNKDDPQRLQDKFDPHLFRSSCVIATAGSDKTLALWNLSNTSPLLVLKDLVNKPIVDLCWDKEGNSIFLASLDGHLTIITFEDQELGIKENDASLIEVNDPIDTKPFNAKQETVNPRSKGSNTVEILDQKDATSVFEITNDLNKDISEAEDVNVEIEKPPAINNDRHNFTPKLVSSPSMDPDNVDDIMNNAMDRHKHKEKESSKEKELPKDKELKSSLNGNANNTSNGTAANKLDLSSQKTTTKNGKKRIQPMLVSNNNKPPVNQSPVKSNRITNSVKTVMEFDKPSYNISDELFKQVKRQKTTEESGKKQKRELEPTKFLGSVVINPNTTFSKTRLATPKVRLGFSLTSNVETEESFILDIKNGTGNDEEPSRITYFKKDKQIWCDFIPRFIHLATEGSSFWAISTNDGQILTYSHTSGKRILPPIILGSPISFLESHGEYLMAISSIGELFVWDINNKKSVLNSPSSINSLLDASNKYQEEGLSKSNRITMCSITSKGIPLITLSNGSGYLFNKDLNVWQTISESWWAFGSHYWDSLSNGDNSNKIESTSLFGDPDESIIGLLEHKTNEEIVRNTRAGRARFFNKISKNMLMKEGFENLENTVSLSHLENRILCCELLGEKKDFHEFFLTYVKRVCELGLKAKVFEICNQLLGPSDLEDDTTTNWNDEICGIKKHELLKEVILGCSDLRDSQRILTHFAKKVGLL